MSGDLQELAAAAEDAGATPVAVESLLAHHPRGRITRPVADRVADPGPGLTLTYDRDGLDHVATAWQHRAQQHCSTADKAQLVLRDHDPVAAAERTAATAHDEASGAESLYDEASQAHERAVAAARSAAHQSLAAVAQWAPDHPALRGLHNEPEPTADASLAWDTDNVEALHDAEPATVRDQLNTWAEQALRSGETLAADHENAARGHLATAASHDATAAQHRADARHLRSGQLLPLPAPPGPEKARTTPHSAAPSNGTQSSTTPTTRRRCSNWPSPAQASSAPTSTRAEPPPAPGTSPLQAPSRSRT